MDWPYAYISNFFKQTPKQLKAKMDDKARKESEKYRARR